MKLVSGRWVKREVFKKGKVWYGRVRDSRTGRLREFSTHERRKEDAEQAVLDFIHELEGREEDVPNQVRFDAAYEEFLDLKDVRPITLENYKKSLKGIYAPAFGKKFVFEIEVGDIERFLRDTKNVRQVSARTRAKYLTELRSFFRWARRRRYCSEDPTDGLKVGRVAKRQGVALTYEQARALLQVCREKKVMQVKDARRGSWNQSWSPPPHLFIAILIALHTGLRRGNITRMRWGQIDLQQRKLTIRAEEMKANADHLVPLHPELSEALTSHLRSQEHPNANSLVLGIDVFEMTRSFRTALSRAELPHMRFHDLRHTAATWWGMRCPYVALRQLLGHSPGPVTLQYAQHVPFEELKRLIDSMPPLLGALSPSPVVAAP